MPFSSSLSSLRNPGYRSENPQPSSPRTPSRSGWAAADFAPAISTDHTPQANRTGSFASKIYRALSINRREAEPSPPSRRRISSPIPNSGSPIQYSGRTVDVKRHQKPPDMNSPVPRFQRLQRSHSRPLGLSSLPEGDRSLSGGRSKTLDPSDDWPTSPSSMAPSPYISDTPAPSPLRGRHHSMSAARGLSINTFPSFQSSADSELSVPSPLQPLTPVANDSQASSPVATLSTGTSLRSAASTQFRIKRKPVPRFDEGGTKPIRKASMPDSPSEKTPTSMARHQPLDSRNAPDRNGQTEFQLDLDRLFDELFDECRSGASTTTVRPSPANSTHRRSMSDHPEPYSSSICRVQTIRRQSRGILRDSGANNIDTPTARAERRKSKTNPFFASGREFGASRSSGRPKTSDAITPTGRVRNAVMEIEQRNASPTHGVATPIKKLGSILDRAPLVDSTDLSLESKRMMEAARLRRSIR